MKRLIPWLLLLSLSPLAVALPQEGGAPPGPGAGHAPPQDGRGAVGEGEAEADGPNLQVPDTVKGPARAQLEQAIASWKGVYQLISTRGPRGNRERLDAVIEELEASRKTAKGCALPSHYLGIAYQLLGLYYGERDALETAVHRLKASARMLPGFHETLVELGDAHGHVGKLKDARKAYDDAVAAAPTYALAYRRRAALLLEQGAFDAARVDVVQALEQQPKDKALVVLKRKLDLVIDGPPWAKKFEVESKHYIVRTNVSQEFGEDIADQAELIRRLYEQIFPRGSKSKRKFPIVVFASKQEYHQNGGPPSAGGHFDPLFKQLFLFRYPKASDTRLVLYHEGFHQFLDGILDVKPPQWFNEGVADFFGPSKHHKVKGEEGMKIQTNPWRLPTVKRLIKKDQTVPFERLMTMTQAQMYGQNASNHYAQAWSMIYFFAQADDGAHFKYLKSYFKALRKGKDRLEAYEAAFGKTDMGALEQRWREFMLKLRR